MLWLVAADLVTLIHAAYVAVVVLGFAAILIGWAAGWDWVHNSYFRIVHVAMILLVCCEAIIGATCPLTIWENMLRAKGGESGYSRDFVGYWLDSLIFYQTPPWVFTTAYLTFGAVVVLAFWLVPMQWPSANRSAASDFTRRNSIS
jgi:uncharacterized protein DUF2784